MTKAQLMEQFGQSLNATEDTIRAIKEEQPLADSVYCLLDDEACDKDQLAALLAARYNLPHMVKPIEKIDAKAFEILTMEHAKKLRVYPIACEGSSIHIATSNPSDIFKYQKLTNLCELNIKCSVATDEIIQECLKYAEANIDQLTGITEGFLLTDDEYSSTIDTNDDNAGPVVQFINTTLKTALNKRASDIHIECYERYVAVKYRIDGQLYSATEDLSISHHSSFVSRLKVMAELDIAEKRIPQDGRFNLIFGGRSIDFRLSIIPGIHGENIVIRILDKDNGKESWENLSFSALGMSETQLAVFDKVIREPYGMILITGPTGSGKTTTLYTALKQTNTGTEKTITIEDPVEYQLPGITQIPVNNKKGLTFAKGLRSILRHDPDKILIGEIRDAETADIAIQSALTGHLVLSSVHANNAIDVLARLSNMGVNVNNAISALNAIMAQRLLRILCNECKVQDDECQKFAGHEYFKAVGCQSCNWTGYSGREMISELIIVDEEIRTGVLQGTNTINSFRRSNFVGGESLRTVALERYQSGKTSIEEVNRVTSE